MLSGESFGAVLLVAVAVIICQVLVTVALVLRRDGVPFMSALAALLRMLTVRIGGAAVVAAAALMFRPPS